MNEPYMDLYINLFLFIHDLIVQYLLVNRLIDRELQTDCTHVHLIGDQCRYERPAAQCLALSLFCFKYFT